MFSSKLDLTGKKFDWTYICQILFSFSLFLFPYHFQKHLGAFGLLILWACNPSKKEADLQTPLFLLLELISVLFHWGCVHSIQFEYVTDTD